MVIMDVTSREKNIIKIEVNRLLKVLEKRLMLRGDTPKQRYRWDQKPIIDIVVEQVGGALKVD